MVKRRENGPQGELSQDEEVLHEDRHDLAFDDRVLYEAKMEELRQENGFLTDQLQRALKELKAYQIQYPSARSDCKHAAEEMADLPSWNTSYATMSPLVAAYDRRTEDLEKFKQAQAEKLQLLGQKVEELVHENEELRASQLDLIENTTEVARNGGGKRGETSSRRLLTERELETTERLAELRERSDIMKAENSVLVKQATLTSRELEQTSQDLEDRDRQIQHLIHNLKEAGLMVHSLEEELANAQDEKAQCESQLLQTTSELNRSTTLLTEHKAALETAQNQVEILTIKLEESRKTIQKLNDRLEHETDALTSKYQACGKRIRELQHQLVTKTQDLDIRDETIRRLSRELETTRLDAEGMLKVMSGMQKQVDDHARKEQEMDKMTIESREQVEQALLERDQVKGREVQTRRELARLLEFRKIEAEKRMEEIEGAVAAGKVKLTQQYEKREAELKDALAQVAKMKVELDKCIREKRSSDSLYSELCTVLKDEQGSVRSRFQELQQRLVHTELEREGAEARTQQAIKDLSRIRQEMLTREEKLESARRKLDEQVKVREREASKVREMHRRAEAEHEIKVREVSKLQQKLEEINASWQARLDNLRQTHKDEMEAGAIRLYKAETALREQEPIITELEASKVRVVDKVKAEHKSLINRLEQALREERELVDCVSGRNQELSARLACTTNEKGDLLLELEGTKEEMEQLEDDLAEAKRKLCEVGAKLSECLGAQQRLVKDEARLRSDLNRANIELSRRGVVTVVNGGDQQVTHRRP